MASLRPSLHWRAVLTFMLAVATALSFAVAFALPATATAPTDHRSSGTAATVGDPGQPQPLSTADMNSGGANGQCPGGAYCSTRNGSASGNGNQTQGQHKGEPCAGCVGKADNKNPHGQRPNGTDHNAGYECDRNHGIGRTNPAHTGCTAPTTPTPTPTPTSTSGSNCTTNPTGPGCTQSSGGSQQGGCVPTAANNFCSNVLGEKLTTPPSTTTTTTTTPSPKKATVLGERFVRTPSSNSLPFTGSTLLPLLLTATFALGLGSLALMTGRRRRS